MTDGDLTLKEHYFNQLNAFRKAVTTCKFYDQKQLLFFWNLVEAAYKRVGYDFGDTEDTKLSDDRRVRKQWWQDTEM